jgi:hypothetical protein
MLYLSKPSDFIHAALATVGTEVSGVTTLVSAVLLVTGPKPVKSLNTNQHYQGSQNVVINSRKTKITKEWGARGSVVD